MIIKEIKLLSINLFFSCLFIGSAFLTVITSHPLPKTSSSAYLCVLYFPQSSINILLLQKTSTPCMPTCPCKTWCSSCSLKNGSHRTTYTFNSVQSKPRGVTSFPMTSFFPPYSLSLQTFLFLKCLVILQLSQSPIPILL